MYGEKIRKMREYYGYSQRELAEKINIPSTTLSFWERAEYPSLEGIIKICGVFKIKLWEFFIEDYSEVKKILPDFIAADDAALLRLLNTQVEIKTRIQVKKTFLEIIKLVLNKESEKYKHMPEYRMLFKTLEYQQIDESISSPIHDEDTDE